MNDTLRNGYVYWMFVLPAVALYALFFMYPMITTTYYGFTDWNGLMPEKFVGLDNFVQALQNDMFVHAIRNNLIFILFSVFVQVPLIIFFALLISGVKRLRRFYKTMVFMPSILSTSVIGILWSFIYEPEIGLLNQFLGLFGVEPIYWLSDTKTALLSVLITNGWQWMGFYIILVLAAILSLPKELNEAAEIDGATGIQRALYITVPLIMPIISVVIMLSIAGAMRVVDIVLVMTNGGPAGETDVMASYMVLQATQTGQYGYGTAIAILIFVFALVLTGLYQLLFARKQERIEY